MTAQVIVLLGPVRSGKTQELLRHYRSALKSGPPENLEPALWFAPNARTAVAIRDELLRDDQTACLHPGVQTFDDFLGEVLIAAHARLKILSSTQQRDLVRHVIQRVAQRGSLQLFAEAAQRPGFLGLVAGHITELKRRNIRPDAYSNTIARGSAPPEQIELARIYTEYEALLTAHNLVDHEGAHRAACDALANNTRQRFKDLALVVADGFTDFTSTQFEVFRQLSQRAKQILISLPLEQGSPRHDLFAKVAAALDDLKHGFPDLEARSLPARTLPNASIDHVARYVFSNPKQIPTPPTVSETTTAQLEIIAAASVQDEVNQVARRIKSLLVDRAANSQVAVRPGNILVVARSLTTIAPRVKEVFERFEIPYFLEARPAAITAPAIKILLYLLQLDQDDWPFRRVVSTLTNNRLTAFDEDARRAADWLVRDLQIAVGGKTLLERVQSLAADKTPASDRSSHLAERVDAAQRAHPALKLLAGALQELPNQATPTEWCAALEQLAVALGLAPFSASEESRTTIDQSAWRSIQSAFAGGERLDQWLKLPSRRLNRLEFVASLRDIATNASLPLPDNEVGRVRVLSASAARNISAQHLFLIGMSEQSFPSPEQSGRLATDAEYRQLAGARKKPSKSIAPPATAAQAEMLLFYEVISRAEKSLTISYPALDDKAQSLPPSPYVVELERVFADATGEYIRRSAPRLSPVDSDAEGRSAESRRTSGAGSDARGCSARGPYSIADWRTRAIAEAIAPDGDRRLLAGIFATPETQPLAAAIDAGLRIVHARSRGDAFGPNEGLLQSPAIAARLARQFGPQHAWSASQWETYATCPFRFFMQHVLGLEPLGDLVLETDFSRRGSRLHDVLATFHRDWLRLRKSSYASPLDEEAAFLGYLRQIVDERTTIRNQPGVDAALAELDRRQIQKWAKQHYGNQYKYDDACHKLNVLMTPTYFEFRFGPERRGGSESDPNSTTSPFVLDIKGESVQITGQIDRIDVGELDGQKLFNVIDYKSGRRASLKLDQLETGQQLQLPIYVEAAQALLFKNDATPLQAGYWGMGSGFDSKGALATAHDKENGDVWGTTHDTVRRLIRTFIDNIRKGEFPVDSLDDKCTSTCDYRLTCRIGQARAAKKTQHAEAEELTTESTEKPRKPSADKRG